jgi:Caspase domain
MRLGVTRILQFLAAAAVGALFLASAPDSALAEKRVALVVGNSNYKNVARLPNPERDAASIAKLFREAGFDTVIEANNVGNLDFKRAIRKFEDASQDSAIAVVYYAGHGIEVNGINYLVPVDAKLASDRDAEDEAISLNRVVESVEGAKQLKLIILDACRDDPFVNTMKRFRRVAFRGIAPGLAAVAPTSSDTLIAYAAKAGSTAEDGEGKHSPFTTALLDNLTVPGLDIRLAFGRIRDEVLKITDQRQVPYVYGSLGGGNISLVPQASQPKPRDVAAPQGSNRLASREEADYKMVAQIGTKQAWEVFLGTYPTGFYSDLARAQLAKLGASGSRPTVLAKLEPPPTPQPAKPTTDETRSWNKIKDSSDRDALEKFIERYPNSPLAVNAQHRLDILDQAAKDREAKARAEREAALRAAQERLAKQSARLAAQQKADEEQRAKEAARIAELKAENERRSKQAADSEKQKQDKAARIAVLQAEIDRRSKQLADSERKKAELTCAREQARLDDLKAAGNSAAVRDDLQRLSQDLTCERLRPQVVAVLDKVTTVIKNGDAPPENTPALVASAQKELTRLGCYAGDQDGKLDAATKVAIKKYKEHKQQALTDIAVTDRFVHELGKEKLRVCPAVVVDKPTPDRHHKETKKTSKKDTRHEAKQERHKSKSKEAQREKPQARQQARASGGGGHATMIGIGF